MALCRSVNSKPPPLHTPAGAEVRGTVAQQRQAARLAGRRSTSLLECAESVCSQAAAAAAGHEQADQGERFGPTQLSQLTGQLTQLNREDQEELQRLVGLVRRIRDAVGREPLPQAVLRVLQVGQRGTGCGAIVAVLHGHWC